MVPACETHHVKLAIAFQTRYSPRLKVIRELIAGGKLGDSWNVRSRGKEDSRGGGQDLMVLGTHLFDLMRLLAGDARWCHARILQNGKPATKSDVTQGGEGMGPVLGDWINATYGFDQGVEGDVRHAQEPQRQGHRASAWRSAARKGIIQLTTGSLPAAYFLDDPSWFPGQTRRSGRRSPAPASASRRPLKDGGLGRATCGSRRT